MDRRPGRDEGAARVSFGLVAAVLLHVLMIGGAFLWGLLQKTPEAPPEPIAVEFVEEALATPAPQEPEKGSAPEPESSVTEPPPLEEAAVLPPTDPIDLTPAFDAPKSAQNDEALTIGEKGAAEAAVAAAADESRPPSPEKPPVEPQVSDLPQQSARADSQSAPQETAREAPPVEPLPQDPEGIPALAQPVTKPDAETAEAGKPETPDAKRFAFFAPVPKIELESGRKETKAPGGGALDTYTTRLYGMIMPLVRVPPGIRRPRPIQIDFVVDGRGRLAGAVVARSSGVPSLDVAVLYAIRQAAPFPPTPEGKPVTLTLDYALE